MPDLLLDLCRQYADTHANQFGITTTPVQGLTIVRSLHLGELQAAVSKPLIAMLLQGRKRVTTNLGSFDYGPGEALVITADIPTISQITQASISAPYYSLVLELNFSILRELQIASSGEQNNAASVGINQIDNNVADAASRLVRLFEQQNALTILENGLVRELHYWLLQSEHRSSIRALAITGSSAERVSRAVAILRKNFMQSIRISELASVAGMSESVFHKHFRAFTTLSPLQFQKQLRLIHARTMILAEGGNISQNAYKVGYASVPQFTREYTRMFNISPGRDIRKNKDRT